MKLLTYQPDSIPPGHYVVTLDGQGGIATAVHHRAAPPFQPGEWIRLIPDWEKNLILMDGPLDVASEVLGRPFVMTIQKKHRFRTLKELLNGRL